VILAAFERLIEDDGTTDE